MRRISRRLTSAALVIVLLCQLFSGCSSSSTSVVGNSVPEEYVQEILLLEKTLPEDYSKEAFIVENLKYEDGVYEYNISEDIICEVYTFEITVGEISDEELLSMLPQEISEYDIDWPSVILKFAAGTIIIVAVGVINYFAESTYFVFSAVDVAKDALIGGVLSAVINVTIEALKNGELPEEAVTKYAIEGFADGYMWGAISSVLKICIENFSRLSTFKQATGGALSIKLDGSVFDDAGKLVGQAYYGLNDIWYISTNGNTVSQIFDKAGNEITDAKEIADALTLPRNSKLRLGTSFDADICQTDDAGHVFRIGDELLPDTTYTINGYSYSTDSMGRKINVVFDDLQIKENGVRRQTISDAKSVIGKGFEHIEDDRGHLIADMFCGDNSMANIVAQDSSVNKGAVKAIETEWRNILENGGHISGRIEVSYIGDSYRPERFTYIYSTGEIIETRIINNHP